MKTEDMGTTDIQAKIEIGLHSNCMRDRPGYKTGIRPNHWIPGRDYTFMGQIDFMDREWLKPGESCIATGRFIIALQDKPYFVPGFTWHICEANKIIGYGKILEIEST